MMQRSCLSRVGIPRRRVIRPRSLFTGLQRLSGLGQTLVSPSLGVRHSTSSVGGLPDSSRVVVCGGGVIGCSVAYHLPKVGIKDVLVLEQGRYGTLNLLNIGCGTTWHAAALVGLLRASPSLMSLCKYSAELYASLEEETGLGTGWKNCGSISLARSEDRFMYLKRLKDITRARGTETELITPQQVGGMCPLIRTDDLVGGLWVPEEGVVTSTDVCHSLAKGATLQGVRLCEDVSVESVQVENGRVCGVRTNKGDIKCEIFVNCAGMWARELGQISDPPVALPLHASEHFYIVTKPINGVDLLFPAVRDLDVATYFREWSGGILTGGFEPRGKPCFQDGVPKNFEFQLLPEDWDQFSNPLLDWDKMVHVVLGPLMEQILHRMPDMEYAEIRQFVNGPESFTTDMQPLLGETAEIQNYFVAVGMNSAGIAEGGGLGRALAEWISDGKPSWDLRALDVRRMGSHDNNAEFLRERISEVLGKHYTIPWPVSEMETGRDVKMSPLYPRLDEAGASWGCVMGWERANWFAKSTNEPRVNSRTFGKPNWFENVREEHLACREKVAIFDLSSLAKFEIEGPGAEAAMQELCANDVAVPPGQIVYTGMLNHRGGYVTDCTVTRLAQNKFLAVCPAGQAVHDAAWISRHLPRSVSLRDVTARYSVLAVMGPQSRDLLQTLTRSPLDNTSFPFGTMQIIDIGFASGVFAMRADEHEWELHCPSEYALGLYDKLMTTGKEWGVRNAGMLALESLRMEQGQRTRKELDPGTTPLEAQLEHIVCLERGNFIGREALLKQKEEGVRKLLGVFTVDTRGDEDVLAWGYENIYRNGDLVGYVSSACFGYLVGKPICMGYISGTEEGAMVTSAFLKEGHYEVEIHGKMYPAELMQQHAH